VLTVSLVIAATATAAALVHHEFFRPPTPGAPKSTVEYMPSWQSLVASGRTIGDSSAPVKIVEFADLQCPFCRQFNRSIRLAIERYPSKVSLVFIHFPLRGHSFALPGARAVECAHAENKFVALVDLLYERQDSLTGKNPADVKMWVAFAREVGVRDTLRFERCMETVAVPPMVEAGLKVGEAHKISRTPTVIINGWRYSAPPSDSEMVRGVSRILEGKSPHQRSLFARLLGRG